LKSSLRALVPDLPKRTWQILAADGVSALGTGLVLPFLVVYLRDVRDIPVQTAALAISTIAVMALIAGPSAGVMVDRYGSRRVLIASLLLCSAGTVGLAFIRETWHAFAATAVFGVGIAAIWPATHSLLSSVVKRHQRSSVFAVHYATLNAGIGIGGIIGGLVADVNDPATFEWLYSIDALSWLVFAALLFVMKDVGAPHPAPADEAGGKVGYGAVLKDRNFLYLMGVAAVLVTIGYSQLESGFPAYVTGDGGATTRLLGFTFAANTAVIVAFQLPVLKFMEGRRRTRALMAICVLWAIAWLVTIGAGNMDAGALKNAGFILAMMFFALGECMVSPSIPGILNDLASDELRGRYNAGYSLTFSIGHIVGPAVAGFMLGRELPEPFFVALVVAAGMTIVLIRGLERRLPIDANLMSSEEQPPVSY
jgi:MFS family permease